LVQVDSPLVASAPAIPLEFLQVVAAISAQKGESVAKALEAAAKMSGDPVASIKEAAAQIGVTV
jgi:hypothetical protein